MTEQPLKAQVEPQPVQQMNAEPIDAEQVLARSGRTFHLAARLLPRRMRVDATELYAFCQSMDDLADEAATEEGAGNRDQLAHAIRVLNEDPLGNEAAAFGWPIELEARFPGINKVAVHLTQSLAADASSCRIATQEELQHYAFGVAGTVGLMMCRILGAPPAGAEAASHLGIAMQLTNIARDVQEDLGRDRVYLPAEWITPADLVSAIAGGDPAPLVDATQRLLKLAESFYADAAAGMHYLPWRARVSILAASACYREIGISVGSDTAASWRQRTVVSGRRKAALVMQSFARSFIAGRHRQPCFAATATSREKSDSRLRGKP